MAKSYSHDVALGYKESSDSFQKVDGKMFIETDVCPQAGDVILDLGCGTGELSAYLAGLVRPEGKVVGVDPEKERLLLAQQSFSCFSKVKNLSFVEGSASNFPGVGSESYDIIFSNYVIHWIPDKQELFKNMFESLKRGGKIAIQYMGHLNPLETAFKVLNPENAQRFSEMCHSEERAKIEEHCSHAGFHIIKSCDTFSNKLVFENIESLLKWLYTTTHGVFDPNLAIEERLQRYYPYSIRDGKPPFDLRLEHKDNPGVCQLIAIKPTGNKP